MSFDFAALERALAPIAEVAQGETTFDVGGTSVTMRVLRPDEERAVQRYAGGALSADSGDPVQASEYLDRFRTSTLAYALVAVGDVKFPDFVLTGETLSTGVPVQVERNKALRPMIEKWARPVMVGCFKKWAELIARVEKDAEKAIVFEPSDVDSEIERLKERLGSLEREKETTDKSLREGFSKQVERLAVAEEDVAVAEEEPVVPPVPVTTVPVPAAPPPQVQATPGPPQPRRSVVPASAPPPVAAKPPVAARAPEPDAGSFVDAGDEDDMQRAVNAEHARLAARRAGQAVPGDGSVLTAGGPRVGPIPHLDARLTEEELRTLEQGRKIVAEQARKLDDIDGVETYAMPTQALDSRQDAPAGQAPLNAAASGNGTTNPRFRPPPKI